MKKLNILRLLSTVAIAAAGVFGIASVKEGKKAETVKADSYEGASTTMETTIWWHWSGSWNITPYITFKVGNTWVHDSAVAGFSKGIHRMSGDTGTSGTASFNVPTNTNTIILIHSGDGSSWHGKTNDLGIIKNLNSSNGLCNYVNSEVNSSPFTANWGYYGGLYNQITYNANGGSGTINDLTNNVDCQYVSSNKYNYYLDKANVSNGGGFNKTGCVISSWNTSPDGSGTSVAKGSSLAYANFLNYKQGTAITLYAQWRASYTSNFYVYGDFNGESTNWDIASAKMLTPFSESGYSYSTDITVTLTRGDKFKICYYNDSTGSFDYDNQNFDASVVQSDSSSKYCFDLTDADGVIECVATGSYIIRLHNFENQGKTIWLGFGTESGLGSRTAQQLAAYLMKFGPNPSSGHCQDSDRFPFARSMYLNQLNSPEKSTFQGYSGSSTAQFNNAYKRYTDWAKALGEDPWSSNKANSQLSLIGLTTQTTNNVAILVIISVVSVGAIGGYFFIRKRKENN